MKPFAGLIVSACLIASILIGANATQPRDLGREILEANDGWASLTTGTTGGSTASANHASVKFTSITITKSRRILRVTNTVWVSDESRRFMLKTTSFALTRKFPLIASLAGSAGPRSISKGLR